MKATQFTKALTIKPSKATEARVDYRLALQAARVTPKRRAFINQPVKSNLTVKAAKVLVWAAIL